MVHAAVQFMDIAKVKQNVDCLQHTCPVGMLALNQQGTRVHRKVLSPVNCLLHACDWGRMGLCKQQPYHI